MQLRSPNNRGFTLVETMVAAAVVAIILVSIITGGVSLQKIFAGSDASMKANADQTRILDYIARDLRQALTVAVSNGGQTLTLTVPPYLDPNTDVPVIPSVKPGGGSGNGTVDYGDSSSPTTVTYFPANAPTPPSTTYTYHANGEYLIRQVGAKQTVISLDCKSLQINFTDNTTSVGTWVSFAPRFNFSNQTSARDGTKVYAITTLRNTRRN
jgi:prepilin-type N-terminal cleavage/methylation domain-containing protein